MIGCRAAKAIKKELTLLELEVLTRENANVTVDIILAPAKMVSFTPSKAYHKGPWA